MLSTGGEHEEALCHATALQSRGERREAARERGVVLCKGGRGSSEQRKAGSGVTGSRLCPTRDAPWGSQEVGSRSSEGDAVLGRRGCRKELCVKLGYVP